jgi:hypothetical protein
MRSSTFLDHPHPQVDRYRCAVLVLGHQIPGQRIGQVRAVAGTEVQRLLDSFDHIIGEFADRVRCLIDENLGFVEQFLQVPGKPVSAWLAEAATEKARAAALHAAGRAAARELVAEYESEHGPLPAASRQRARQFLIEAGLIDDEPQPAAG